MYVNIAVLLLFSSVSFAEQWTLDTSSIRNFFDESSQNMNEFFQEKKKMVETLFTNSYNDAVRVSGSVNQYMEDQQKKISSEVNNYVESMKKSGRKMADTFSFVPDHIDDADRLDNPDVVLSVPAIIQRNGYPSETHTVTSQGYVLNIHRIPRSKHGASTPRNTVILHHGLFASSADWILNGPDKALAYVLAEAGYDVWMPNIRGNALGSITSSCRADNMDGTVCKNVVFHLCGYNEGQFNKTLLPVFLAHIGTGTSWKTAVHFSQEIESGGRFQKFDYGSHYNKQLYGSETAPEYDLSRITLPIKLFWAQNDLLSSERDVQRLRERLPRETEMYLVPDPHFNHIDYLWAKDAPTLLNHKVLETLHRAFAKNIFSIDFRLGK